ncbi:Cytosolic sulfotransferase 5 [Linum grandiflorum]
MDGITSSIDKEPCWDVELIEIEGFWYHTPLTDSIDAFRANFKPEKDDNVVILASSMKTGTTWLKALSHCILFRDENGEDRLTKMNPHLCVPSLEAGVYLEDPSSRKDLEQGRLFNTHMPYSYLPDSIKKDCKLVYITRDPKDTLVSQWHFFNKIFKGNIQHPLPLERAADIFCNGRIPFGPYWEHVLEYWEASRASPDKVMFIKYEDLRRDPKQYVHKLALFLGKPFVDGDKDDVEVEKVIWRSSFDRLKDLDVNKTGKSFAAVVPLLTNNLFFRRGEVGDWRNHLTAEMAKRIDDVTREKFRCTGLYLDDEEVLSRVQGFWYLAGLVGSVNAFREKFKPNRYADVVILASNPKTGTTWLKALSYCIMFRDDDEEEDRLTKMNPHLCVPFLEADVYLDVPSSREHLAEQGRLFNTHMPYSYLPDSIKNDCKLVYITRDPKDTFVSQWHFYNAIYNIHDPLTLEKAAEIFCNGRSPFGPFWDHVLEYWEVSQTSPEKVMFVKYEDLHHNPKLEVRKLASFLGKPFGDADKDDVEVDKIIWRSSFDRLKDLDVNKTGKSFPAVAPLLTNNLFFRRGEVGDWRNHLTAEIAKRIDDITREKFRSTGLYLDEDEESKAGSSTLTCLTATFRIRLKKDCKLVYITREPKDTLVSQLHFFNKIYNSYDPLTLERAVEIFCNGRIPFGPFWEHVLEYWEASQTSPEKVMFIKYEDLRPNPKVEVRKLASFLGKPFGDGDDVGVERVIWRSSFDRLKDLDTNKNGKLYPETMPLLTNNLFFRRGEVGDWRNHLTVEVARRIDDVTQEKFRCAGLYLDDEEEAI